MHTDCLITVIAAGKAIGPKRKTDDEIMKELDADFTCPITQVRPLLAYPVSRRLKSSPH